MSKEATRISDARRIKSIGNVVVALGLDRAPACSARVGPFDTRKSWALGLSGYVPFLSICRHFRCGLPKKERLGAVGV